MKFESCVLVFYMPMLEGISVTEKLIQKHYFSKNLDKQVNR